MKTKSLGKNKEVKTPSGNENAQITTTEAQKKQNFKDKKKIKRNDKKK